MTREIRQIHGSLVELIGVLNRPQPDRALLKEAGVALDQVLFPLLVGIARHGPIGVVSLAELAGRDYSTVSRQVAKLEASGLVTRRSAQTDRRVTETLVTSKGRAFVRSIDAARERLVSPLLAEWSERDILELSRLLRRLADTALTWSRTLEKEPAA